MITRLSWFMALYGTGLTNVSPVGAEHWASTGGAARRYACQELRGRDAWTVLDAAVSLLTHWPIVLLVAVLLLVTFRRAAHPEQALLRHERRRNPRRDRLSPGQPGDPHAMDGEAKRLPRTAEK